METMKMVALIILLGVFVFMCVLFCVFFIQSMRKEKEDQFYNDLYKKEKENADKFYEDYHKKKKEAEQWHDLYTRASKEANELYDKLDEKTRQAESWKELYHCMLERIHDKNVGN